MTGWRLEPAGIQVVLKATEDEAEGLYTDLNGAPEAPVDHFGSIMAGLGSEAAELAPVYDAVGAALAAQGESVTSISNRIRAGVLGVLNAALAYEQGNQDMAVQCQSQAAAAATSGDFSWFEQHGVV